VLGAMETGYQRGRIQDESLVYETGKHDGSIPIIGANTFRGPAGDRHPDVAELARSDDSEKQAQLRRLRPSMHEKLPIAIGPSIRYGTPRSTAETCSPS
jgi:methylmalonyl-CoA mutase